MRPSLVSVSREVPWNLRRRGSKDSARHDIRIQDAIRKNLRELISHEDILSSDGTQRIRVPLKYLEQYRFKAGQPGQQGVGQGQGTIGDALWSPGQSAPGDEAGDQPDEHEYEIEVDLDTLTKMMLEELALPWLEAKPQARELAGETYEFADLRRRGQWANLDKRRTLRENALRNAAKKQPGVRDLLEEDLRFRTWTIHHHDVANAVIYLLMDESGSMTDDKKHIARVFFFWLVRFVRLKYVRTDLVFIGHDTEAEILSEQDFFTRSMDGGTRCSSAYKVALGHMQQHYPAARFNCYLFHFSDGDNLPDDNAVCRALVEEVLRECQQVGYGEIPWARATAPQPSGLLQALRHIQSPRLLTTVLRTPEDVQAALRLFFGQELASP